MAGIRRNKMTAIIDSHLHLFELSKGKYDWLKPENPPFWPDKPIINKNFTEEDLRLVDGPKLKGFVHIEAGFDNEQPWREIEWLEETVSLPFKSIACVDLYQRPEQMTEVLNSLSQFKSVVGVRHILDDEAASILTSEHIDSHFAAIEARGLIFELQMPLTDSVAVNTMTSLLSAHPNLRIAINHSGWPPTEQSSTLDWNNWKQGLTQLSRFTNCIVKASGWEMVQREYSMNWQRIIIATLLETFGTDRVLAASNFPLCLFSHNYQSFWQQIEEVSAEEKKALLFNNAFRFYRF